MASTSPVSGVSSAVGSALFPPRNDSPHEFVPLLAQLVGRWYCSTFPKSLFGKPARPSHML